MKMSPAVALILNKIYPLDILYYTIICVLYTLYSTCTILVSIFNSYSAGIDFSRQNLTSVDVRF